MIGVCRTPALTVAVWLRYAYMCVCVCVRALAPDERYLYVYLCVYVVMLRESHDFLRNVE